MQTTVVAYPTLILWENDKISLHRVNGPACIMQQGTVQYYLYGVRYLKDHYYKRLKLQCKPQLFT